MYPSVFVRVRRMLPICVRGYAVTRRKCVSTELEEGSSSEICWPPSRRRTVSKRAKENDGSTHIGNIKADLPAMGHRRPAVRDDRSQLRDFAFVHVLSDNQAPPSLRRATIMSDKGARAWSGCTIS